MSVYAHAARLVWRSVTGILLTSWFQISLFKHSGFPAVCTQVEVRGPVACRVASLVAAAFTHGAISAALTCL